MKRYSKEQLRKVAKLVRWSHGGQPHTVIGPRDPLTKKQRAEFKKRVAEEFDQEYEKALRSGAFGDDVLAQGDHTIARIVIRRVGHSFRPLSDEGLAAEENYAKF